MRIADIKAGNYHGTVIASIQNRNTKASMRTTLRDPEIEPTAIGLLMTSGDNRVDIDFRGMKDYEPDQHDYCSIEYPEQGVTMALLFM